MKHYELTKIQTSKDQTDENYLKLTEELYKA